MEIKVGIKDFQTVGTKTGKQVHLAAGTTSTVTICGVWMKETASRMGSRQSEPTCKKCAAFLKEQRDALAATANGEPISIGHIGFAHGFEYFWAANGDLYRANRHNPVMPDGYRCGRFESNIHNAYHFLKQAGLYEFTY